MAENIFAGDPPVTRAGFVDWKAMVEESRRVLSSFNSTIDPQAVIENLSVAEKQIVEIAKAVHTRAKIIVMDEPTSALNEQTCSTLFAIIERLKDDGISVIYITHRLEEIFEIADRTVVLRDGLKSGRRPHAGDQQAGAGEPDRGQGLLRAVPQAGHPQG